MIKYYAHKKDNDKEELIDHLKEVARYAKKFGESFNSGIICEQLGLLHDVGKHTKKFQDVLFHRNGVTRVDHAVVGAIYYYNQFTKPNFYSAYTAAIIASHHSNLQFFSSDYRKGCYNEQIQSTDKQNALLDNNEYEKIEKYIEDNRLFLNIPSNKYFEFEKDDKIGKMLYVRMLLSCLVDADYTATAQYENNSYYIECNDIRLVPNVLLDKLDNYRNELIKVTNQKSGINILRNYVYDSCSKKAKQASEKIYTLNAPTGTAKTLALIKFALECAKKNGQQKIFIVLPYLSIISQNAKIYRDIFGEDVVLEDSSAVEYTEETKLYTERWSAPIIVTTSVRFFELMFKSKSSELRRLHQITNSVVVFDECQTLPYKLIDTTIKAMQSLNKYHTTVLFSTATLPAYKFRKNSGWLAEEIIDDVDWLYKQYADIKKTITSYDNKNKYNPKKLLEKFKAERQCVFIFNTVAKAEAMYHKLVDEKGDNSSFIITSNMCDSHKLDIIETIKKKLSNGEECYLSSTQAIEIGVDIDFPVGAREFAPLDSVIQSAGRVARNAKYVGKFFIFEHEDSTYPGQFYFSGAKLTKEFTDKNDIDFDLNNPKMIEKYYSDLFKFDQGKEDSKKLIEAIEDVKPNNPDWFINVEREYKLIENQKSMIILVPYEGCIDKFEKMRKQLEEQNYFIKKSQMYECRDFCVNISSNFLTDNKKEILSECIPLKLKTENGGKCFGWYLASNDLYDKAGLHKSCKATFVF